MEERVYDKTHPGGLFLVDGRVVDANAKPLDLPAGAPSIGDTGADEAARVAAAEAEAERQAREAEAAEDTTAAEREQLVAAALVTPVTGLADFLAGVTDPVAIEAMADQDPRTTAAAKYEARLAELTPAEA